MHFSRYFAPALQNPGAGRFHIPEKSGIKTAPGFHYNGTIERPRWTRKQSFSPNTGAKL